MKKTIGRCGNCGGAVTAPTVFLSTIPPVPTCEKCGATAKPQGPVIEMNPPRRGTATYDKVRLTISTPDDWKEPLPS